jgi:hypothetical protein
MLDEPLTEAERFPLLTGRSRARLRWLQQHEHAPRWTYQCGERLDAAGLADVQEFAARQRSERRGWKFGQPPAWFPISSSVVGAMYRSISIGWPAIRCRHTTSTTCVENPGRSCRIPPMFRS